MRRLDGMIWLITGTGGRHKPSGSIKCREFLD